LIAWSPHVAQAVLDYITSHFCDPNLSGSSLVTPKLECTVKSVSETGATLKVSTTFGIPKGFDVIIDGKRRHCRSARRINTKIGVKFS
jgi:hypothetical protein